MAEADVVREYRDALLEAVIELETILKELEKDKPGPKRDAKIKRIPELVKRMDDNSKSFDLELRELPKGAQAEFGADKTSLGARREKIKSSVNWINQNKKRDELMSGAPVNDDPDNMTAGQIFEAAKKTQEKSLASTNRSLAAVEQMGVIGADTNAKLRQQTDQMNRIIEDVDTVESNLKRADKQLRVIARRMMTDRIILFALFLMVVAVVAVIIYSIVSPNGKKNTNVPDDVTPQF